MTGTNSTGKTFVTMTCSAGSAGTSASTDTHSNCTFAGTAISTTPEPKSSGSLPSGSRSEIHYPTVLHNSSALYITKKKRKLVRFFTVVAYMFAVSLVAIVLSLYYVFLWNPYLVSLPSGINDTHLLSSSSQSNQKDDIYRHESHSNHINHHNVDDKNNNLHATGSSVITVSLMPAQTESPSPASSSSVESAALTSSSSSSSSIPSSSPFDSSIDFASSSFSSGASSMLDFSSVSPSLPPFISSPSDPVPASSSPASPPPISNSLQSSSDFASAFSSFVPSSDSSASSSTIDWIMDVTNSPNISSN